MTYTAQLEKNFAPQLSDKEIRRNPVLYRGWQIEAKIINHNIWLQYGKTQERVMGFSYPVIEEGLSSALSRVRLLIDLAIKLNR